MNGSTTTTSLDYKVANAVPRNGGTTASAAAYPRVRVDDFGADSTGTNDSTSAFNSALSYTTATYPNGAVLELSAGTYKLGVSSNVSTFGSGYGLIGPGSQICTLDYHGSGTCIAMAAPSGQSLSGAPCSGFGVLGVNAAGGAIGFSWSNLSNARIHDLQAREFNASSTSIGMYFHNAGSGASSEKLNVLASIVNCSNGVVFDTQSFDYSSYQFMVIQSSGQNGVTLQNSAQLLGVDFTLMGDFHGGSGNTAWALGLDPAGNGAGTSTLQGRLNIACEADNSGTGHIPIKFQGADGVAGIYGSGVINFINAGINWQNASASAQYGNIGFSGYFNCPGLSAIGTMGDALAVYGGSQWTVHGSFSNAGSVTSLNVQRGDLACGLLASGNNTVALSSFPSGSAARKLDLYIQQPASGSAGTITWPSNFKWEGGTAPALSSTNGYVDHVRLVYLPFAGNWYGELVGTHYA